MAILAAPPSPMKSQAPTSFFGLSPPSGNTTRSGSLLLDRDGLVLPSPEAAARLRMQRALSEDTCCSFQEWKDAGYWIKKGAKSVFTDCLGTPQFTKEQVRKSNW